MNENKGKHAAVNGLGLYYEIHGSGEPLIRGWQELRLGSVSNPSDL